MNRYAIIVAAGRGVRMGTDIPKQFLEINGKPIVMHTLERFHAFDPHMHLLLVLHADLVDYWHTLSNRHSFSIKPKVIVGGSERFFSVKNAVLAIGDNDAIVGIHDAVRPMVSEQTLQRCYEGAACLGNAIPAVPLNDSLRVVEGSVNHSVDRSAYRIVQTPQCFRLALLKKAFEQDYRTSFTDDASVVEALGEQIHLVEGNRENVKITTSEDLRFAEAFLS